METAAQATELGAFDFIEKPLGTEASLAATLCHTCISPNVAVPKEVSSLVFRLIKVTSVH